MLCDKMSINDNHLLLNHKSFSSNKCKIFALISTHKLSGGWTCESYRSYY